MHAKVTVDGECEATMFEVLTRSAGRSGWVIALVLVVSSCGGTSTDPAIAESCDQLLDVAVATVEAAGDAAVEASGEGFVPVVDELRDDLGVVAARAAELGCGAAASDDFRRAMIDANHDGSRRTLVVLQSAMFDPFLDPAVREVGGTVRLSDDIEEGLARIEDVTASLATDYRENDVEPIGGVHIGSELAIALMATWSVDDADSFAGASEDLALLLLADQGLVNPGEVPMGAGEREDWLDEETVAGEILDALQGKVFGALSQGLARSR